jgi:hypothetical protein
MFRTLVPFSALFYNAGSIADCIAFNDIGELWTRKDLQGSD